MTNKQELMSAFKKVKMLTALPKLEQMKLFTHLSVVKARIGQFIMTRGGEESDLYFIADGQVKVCRADEKGKEITLALLGQGDFIGEMAILTNQSRTADVIALMPCTLLKLSSDTFMSHIEAGCELSSMMLRAMAKRVLKTSDHVTNLALYDVCCRVARTLFGLSSPCEVDHELTSVVNPRPTHQALASMVGSSREVVSRALKTLEIDGHIEYDEDRILVRSLP